MKKELPKYILITVNKQSFIEKKRDKHAQQHASLDYNPGGFALVEFCSFLFFALGLHS